MTRAHEAAKRTNNPDLWALHHVYTRLSELIAACEGHPIDKGALWRAKAMLPDDYPHAATKAK